MVCAIIHVEIRGQLHGIDFSPSVFLWVPEIEQIGRLAEQVPLPGAISLAKSLFLNTIGSFFLSYFSFVLPHKRFYLKCIGVLPTCMPV